MKGEELMRLPTASSGVDLVLHTEERPELGEVWLVLDHYGNGTAEAARLTLADVKKLRSALGTLIRERKGKVRV